MRSVPNPRSDERSHSPLDGPDVDLSQLPVSSTSLWGDDHWNLDARSHGVKPTTRRVRWCIELDDDEILTNGKHDHLLGWLRRVVWGLLKDPGDGADALSPSTMGNISAGLARVVPWLVRYGIRHPSHLTQSVLDSFLSDLPAHLADKDTAGDDHVEGTASKAAARSAINIFLYIWRQRDYLKRSGYQPPPCQPWNGRGAADLADQVVEHSEGWIQPFPDEVAVAMLNSAIFFLDTPARDIQLLLIACDEAHSEKCGLSLPVRIKRQRDAAASFLFATPVGFDKPWHLSLRDRTRSDSDVSTIMLRVRKLLIHLLAACCFAIQSLTGMRASEICSLKSGVDRKTGLPKGVSIRISASGLSEEFILESDHTKGETYPREVPWLLGSRRIGDRELPIAVTAMLILDQLMAPYRAMIDSSCLVVGVSSTQGPPKSAKGVGDVNAERLAEIYREFAHEWVDWSQLPDQSKHAIEANDLIAWKQSRGAEITTHQPRKTFGIFILNVDPQLLPAVQRQFHHLSISITEGGYWGTNTPQLQAVDSVSRQITTRMLYEAVHGKTAFSGRMGKQVAENLDELRRLTAGLTPAGQWTRLSTWVEENNLEATHNSDGTCVPIVAERMECWKREGLRPWGRLVPNFATRTTSMCVGCPAFWIHSDSLPFWTTRHSDLMTARKSAEKDGRIDASFRELSRREKQAAAVLRDLGVDPGRTDASI